MRVINVIEIQANAIVSIESYPIHEEQLSDEVIEKAEKDFETKAIKIGANEHDMDMYLDDGIYENENINKSVNFTWSYIE